MEKEFIPYEQALALKELGFDTPCFGLYENKKIGHSWETSQGIVTPITYRRNSNFVEHILSKDDCTAPTFSQAFRWFREKHNLFHEIHIDKTAEPKFCFDIFQYEHFGNYDEIRIGEWYLYRTQEEAELECLKELIEIIKRK